MFQFVEFFSFVFVQGNKDLIGPNKTGFFERTFEAPPFSLAMKKFQKAKIACPYSKEGDL